MKNLYIIPAPVDYTTDYARAFLTHCMPGGASIDTTADTPIMRYMLDVMSNPPAPCDSTNSSYTHNAPRVDNERAHVAPAYIGKFVDKSGKIIEKRVPAHVIIDRVAPGPRAIDVPSRAENAESVPFGFKKCVVSSIPRKGCTPLSMDAVKEGKKRVRMLKNAPMDTFIKGFYTLIENPRYIAIFSVLPVDNAPIWKNIGNIHFALRAIKYTAVSGGFIRVNVESVQNNANFNVVPFKVCKEKKRVKGNGTYTAPRHEQNTSDNAKNSAQTRKFDEVEKLALQCAIGALKNAIAPRGKDTGKALKITTKREKQATCYYDETLEMCVTEKITLPPAKGQEKGTYTATMRNALSSLQRFAHSAVQAIPDDYNAQEMYSTALVHLYNSAYLLNTSPESYVSGYIDGFAVLRTMTRGESAGKVLCGKRAVYAGCSNAVSTYIRGEKRRVDKSFSVDNISQGNDTTAPEKYDIPDTRSISRMQAHELGQNITLAIKGNIKKPEKQRCAIQICNMLLRGYTQQQIVETLNKSQSFVAKLVSDIRNALLSVPDIAKTRTARGYTAYTDSMGKQLEQAKKEGKSKEQILKEVRERQKNARIDAKKAML